MPRPEKKESFEVAQPSYWSSVLSLIGYGLNSTFGRIYRGIIGIFRKPKTANNEDRNDQV